MLFFCFFFFFNDTATTEIYTLSLHDALPISCSERRQPSRIGRFTDAVAQLWSLTEGAREAERSGKVCRTRVREGKGGRRPNGRQPVATGTYSHLSQPGRPRTRRGDAHRARAHVATQPSAGPRRIRVACFAAGSQRPGPR